jgi:hypothetical protein
MQARGSILKVLAYFDMFDYPVSAGEIMFFLDQPVSGTRLKASLAALISEGFVFKQKSFYTLRNDHRLAERRVWGNKNAQQLLEIAVRNARFLFQFPFVRGIGISGSLSKNFADENADIDYFIVTRANRLWIARSFMHLFKKLSFLSGRQHWYCMNYYVDEEALEITEKNIFTATELITLLPICGDGTLTRFFDANNWAVNWYPHYLQREKRPPVVSGVEAAAGTRHSLLKKALERLFNHRAGNWLDDLLHLLTTRSWQRKEARGARSKKGSRMSLKTGKHFARPNPELFQQVIMTTYNDKIKDLAMKWDINFDSLLPVANNT